MSAETIPGLNCRECGEPMQQHQLAAMNQVAEGEPVAEIRCENGHTLLFITRPDQASIDRGRELADKYGWGNET